MGYSRRGWTWIIVIGIICFITLPLVVTRINALTATEAGRLSAGDTVKIVVGTVINDSNAMVVDYNPVNGNVTLDAKRVDGVPIRLTVHYSWIDKIVTDVGSGNAQEVAALKEQVKNLIAENNVLIMKNNELENRLAAYEAWASRVRAAVNSQVK